MLKTTVIPIILVLDCLLLHGQQPNIVVFLSDDQGYGDYSLTGNVDISTPNIDGIAAAGTYFPFFYVEAICSPTRAEFLTGRYHARSGVTGHSAGDEYVDLDEVTIADVFRAAGYATGAFGKWHSGNEYPYHPMGRGFDEFYGFTEGHWGDYFSPPLDSNGLVVTGSGYIVDDLTDKAIAFMEKNKDKPFFAYVPYNTPHSPMQVPDEYWNRFATKNLVNGGNDHVRAALAMCENIDFNVGRILQKLDDLNLTDNTIVMYFSDNGPNGGRWRAGLKGVKGSTHEGGVRTPFVIQWPGTIPAGKNIPQIGAAIDLLPTLAELAGITTGVPDSLDGVSLVPLIEGDGQGWPDRIIVNRQNNNVSARNQRFRIQNNGELNDILNDPGQTQDVADAFPQVAAELAAAQQNYRDNIIESSPQRLFPVGHPEFPYTLLHAGNAKTSGGVNRSNQWPNSSYYTNWTATNDRIFWPVEVLSDGVFEVDLYYTASEDDIGSTIELTMGNNTLEATITEAHDPPERGMENDRNPRGESYVKDWNVVTLGEIELQAGEGELGLQATDIPGSSVIDFRQIFLTNKSITAVDEKDSFNRYDEYKITFSTIGNSKVPMLNLNLNQRQDVIISLFSLTGKQLYNRQHKALPRGTHQLNLLSDSDKSISDGVFLLKIQVGKVPIYKRLLLF